jgi:transcriptional regulator with XRE-family HTH domain
MTTTTPGQLLRQCRERRELARSECARRMDVSPTHWGDVEQGSRALTAPILARCIPALALTVDETEGIVQALKEERCADLDAVLDGEYARLYPRKAVTA